MKIEIKDLINRCKNSSFNKNSYETNIDIDEFITSLLFYTWYEKAKTNNIPLLDDIEFNKSWLNRVVPEFQRDNNKWSLKMKTKFIENLLSGVKVELLFFKLEGQKDAQIIDGLQRTTAILDFFNGYVKPFGFSYDDLKDEFHRFTKNNLILKIYTFNNWEEVGKFYIDMNEGITHSKEDIQKAKDWFLKEHDINLTGR